MITKFGISPVCIIFFYKESLFQIDLHLDNFCFSQNITSIKTCENFFNNLFPFCTSEHALSFFQLYNQKLYKFAIYLLQNILFSHHCPLNKEPLLNCPNPYHLLQLLVPFFEIKISLNSLPHYQLYKQQLHWFLIYLFGILNNNVTIQAMVLTGRQFSTAALRSNNSTQTLMNFSHKNVKCLETL